MDSIRDIILTLSATLVGSSSFWAYINRKDRTKKTMTQLLMGLAYDKLMTVGVMYIERGWITKDEYEEYRKYLYDPYKELGGNGVAERIMKEVGNLPIRKYDRYTQLLETNIKEVKHDGSHSAL